MIIKETYISVSELCDYWLENYSKPHKKTWTEDEGRICLYIKPAFGDVPINLVDRGMVARLHAEIGTHSIYQANRTRENLHTIFKSAIIWGFLPDHHSNPAKHIKDFREVSRSRYLTEDEIVKLFESVNYESDCYLRGAIFLLLFTGLRRCEVLSLKWEHIYIKEGKMLLIDTKNGENVWHPITQQVAQILATLPRRMDNRYVICGHKKGQPRKDMKRAWNRIRKRAGLEGVKIHDIRRTVGAWFANNGVDVLVIKDVLNHKDIKTTLVYARVANETKQAALAMYGDHIAKLIG